MFKTANKSEKVSDRIIAQIRDAILSGQLKPGDKLASEKELMTQFEVSKATMREALRVLEVIGLIEIRKGTAGGAFVAKVGMKTTIHSLINFIHFQPLSIREITMLRYLIEPTVAQVAAAKITDEDVLKLKNIIGGSLESGGFELSKEIGFHRYLARMAGNTLLTLLIDFIDNLLEDIKGRLALGDRFYREVREAHQMILECLIQKDPLAAGIAMTNDLIHVGDAMCKADGSVPFDPKELRQDISLSDLQLGLNGNARVVSETDPCLDEEGAFVKKIGSGNLRLFVGRDGSD
ncbi:MAG TPA: FadR/GntR family transcriptional regulator [Desulfobacteria bacterium]|nr:FadR/GntR family transcriptional regulator [Desulfobacteria bacterium]